MDSPSPSRTAVHSYCYPCSDPVCLPVCLPVDSLPLGLLFLQRWHELKPHICHFPQRVWKDCGPCPSPLPPTPPRPPPHPHCFPPSPPPDRGASGRGQIAMLECATQPYNPHLAGAGPCRRGGVGVRGRRGMMEWLLNIQQAGSGERGGPGVVVQAALWRRTGAARSLSVSTPSGRSLVFLLLSFFYICRSCHSIISDWFRVQRAWFSQHCSRESLLVPHLPPMAAVTRADPPAGQLQLLLPSCRWKMKVAFFFVSKGTNLIINRL